MAVIGNLLYVHVPKTGGISTLRYLHAVSGGQGLWPMSEDWPFPAEHVPVSAVPKYTGRSIDSFDLIIACIRNPWEQQLSHWLHWRDAYARGGRSVVEMTAAMCHDMTSWLLEPLSDYRVWWEHCLTGDGTMHINELSETAQRLGDYYHWWLQDEEGRLPDTLRFVRFDDLAAGVKALVPSEHDFPHVNRSPKRDSAQHYTRNSLKLVAKRFFYTLNGLFSETFTPPQPQEPRT